MVVSELGHEKDKILETVWARLSFVQHVERQVGQSHLSISNQGVLSDILRDPLEGPKIKTIRLKIPKDPAGLVSRKKDFSLVFVF